MTEIPIADLDPLGRYEEIQPHDSLASPLANAEAEFGEELVCVVDNSTKPAKRFVVGGLALTTCVVIGEPGVKRAIFMRPIHAGDGIALVTTRSNFDYWIQQTITGRRGHRGEEA